MNTSTDMKALFEAVDDFTHAMLITRDPESEPRARPMAVLDREVEGTLWFATALDAAKVDEVRDDPAAGVTMQGHGHFVSMSGTITVMRDPKKAAALWSGGLDPWFPKGPEDPNLGLLRFTPDHAEVWDASGFTGVRYVFEALKATVKGERMDPPKDAHHEVSLR